MTKNCLICGKLFYVRPCLFKKRKVCSKECGWKLQSLHTNWWNKGLTQETDERVKKSIQILEEKVYSKNRNKTYEEIYGEEKAKKIKEKQRKIQHIVKKRMWEEGKLKIPKGEKHPRYGKGPTKSSFKKGDLRIMGKNNPNFNNYSSFEPYDSNWNEKFKNLIRRRDNQVCMNCGIHREKLKKSLDVHHISYNKKLTIPENCVSLCTSCHGLTKINRVYWTKLFQEKLAKLYNYKYSENQDIILNLNKNQLENAAQ